MGTLGRWCAVLCFAGLTVGCSLRGDQDGTSESTDPNIQPLTSNSPDESKLAKMALRLSDMPSGYESEFSDGPPPTYEASNGSDSDNTICGDDPNEQVPAEEKHWVAYSDGDDSPPFVVNSVAQYADESTAEAFMVALVNWVEACHRGENMSYVQSDKTTSLTITGEAEHVVHRRVGDRVMFLSIRYGGTPPDPDMAERLTRLVADRM